jgi:hypothetical protein
MQEWNLGFDEIKVGDFLLIKERKWDAALMKYAPAVYPCEVTKKLPRTHSVQLLHAAGYGFKIAVPSASIVGLRDTAKPSVHHCKYISECVTCKHQNSKNCDVYKALKTMEKERCSE